MRAPYVALDESGKAGLMVLLNDPLQEDLFSVAGAALQPERANLHRGCPWDSMQTLCTESNAQKVCFSGTTI